MTQEPYFETHWMPDFTPVPSTHCHLIDISKIAFTTLKHQAFGIKHNSCASHILVNCLKPSEVGVIYTSTKDYRDELDQTRTEDRQDRSLCSFPGHCLGSPAAQKQHLKLQQCPHNGRLSQILGLDLKALKGLPL